ncbi:MAG: lytic transglycosylase domain-containing protein [Gammaproteobacteria bacterium]|nr:lytic transglycosylase domain-containing protein [Gammaproteobacteria bacterium]
MKSNLISKFAKFVLIPSVIFGYSISSFAGNQLQQALATSQQKSQFTFISNKLNELSLPKELALIPVIESHYNTKAVSPKGAGGLWQLMPATARENGISSGDRFQVGPSTSAALNYFKQLHKQFGNWEFAVAAYNAGGGRVQKALNKNPSATCVQQLNLPQETKQYVKKFYQMQAELKSYDA